MGSCAPSTRDNVPELPLRGTESPTVPNVANRHGDYAREAKLGGDCFERLAKKSM